MLANEFDIQHNKHCHQCFQHKYRKSMILNDLPTMCTLDPKYTQNYVDLIKDETSVKHWGQLKLFLTEMQFLTKFLKISNVTLVYAGSSPGNHLPLLIELMPANWKWHLYDAKPNLFLLGCNKEIKTLESITVHRKNKCYPPIQPYENNLLNKEFVSMVKRNQIPHALKHMQQILMSYEDLKAHVEYAQNFVCNKNKENIEKLIQEKTNKIHTCLEMKLPSAFVKNLENDIRQIEMNRIFPLKLMSNVYVYDVNLTDDICRNASKTFAKDTILFISDIRNDESEVGVQRDMNIQKGLLLSLQPHKSLLKFKLPYSDATQTTTSYFAGDIMLQPYTRSVSHETRLEIHNYKLEHEYNHETYSKNMFNFQTVTRTSIYRKNNFNVVQEKHKNLLKNEICTDHCFDCSLCFDIVKNYLQVKTDMQSLDDSTVLDFLDKIVGELDMTK